MPAPAVGENTAPLRSKPLCTPPSMQLLCRVEPGLSDSLLFLPLQPLASLLASVMLSSALAAPWPSRSAPESSLSPKSSQCPLCEASANHTGLLEPSAPFSLLTYFLSLLGLLFVVSFPSRTQTPCHQKSPFCLLM